MDSTATKGIQNGERYPPVPLPPYRVCAASTSRADIDPVCRHHGRGVPSFLREVPVLDRPGEPRHWVAVLGVVRAADRLLRAAADDNAGAPRVGLRIGLHVSLCQVTEEDPYSTV